MADHEKKSGASTSLSSPDLNERRKADHIRINIEEDVSFKQLTTGFENYFFMHEALPDIDLDQVDTKSTILGHAVNTPLLISSMTGGTAEAHTINRMLAETAQEVGMAMGLGSMRAAIEDRALEYTYKVRDVAPDIPLFANLGVVQLNYGYGLAECQRAVEMIEGDALILHFNALQEAVQPEGDGNFSGLLGKIEQICRELPVPVIAKEVGWGFSEATARRLASAGVAAIDVAGAGGTSWSQVEMYRAPNARLARVAGAFIDWGIPTSVSIQYCRRAAPDLAVIASGGISNGIEVAKAIALGAQLVGIAGDFLRAVDRAGVSGAVELAETVTDELRIAMFACGAGDIPTLANTPLHSNFL